MRQSLYYTILHLKALVRLFVIISYINALDIITISLKVDSKSNLYKRLKC